MFRLNRNAGFSHPDLGRDSKSIAADIENCERWKQ
jgi:hypothetical protein